MLDSTGRFVLTNAYFGVQQKQFAKKCVYDQKMWNAKQIEQYKCFGADGSYMGAYPTNIYNPDYETWLELGGDPFKQGCDITNKMLGREVMPTIADYCSEFTGRNGKPTFACVNNGQSFWDSVVFMSTNIMDPAKLKPVKCQYNYWSSTPSNRFTTCYDDQNRAVGNYADYDYNPVIVSSKAEVDLNKVDWTYKAIDKNGNEIYYTEYYRNSNWIWAANFPYV